MADNDPTKEDPQRPPHPADIGSYPPGKVVQGGDVKPGDENLDMDGDARPDTEPQRAAKEREDRARQPDGRDADDDEDGPALDEAGEPPELGTMTMRFKDDNQADAPPQGDDEEPVEAEMEPVAEYVVKRQDGSEAIAQLFDHHDHPGPTEAEFQRWFNANADPSAGRYRVGEKVCNFVIKDA